MNLRLHPSRLTAVDGRVIFASEALTWSDLLGELIGLYDPTETPTAAIAFVEQSGARVVRARLGHAGAMDKLRTLEGDRRG